MKGGGGSYTLSAKKIPGNERPQHATGRQKNIHATSGKERNQLKKTVLKRITALAVCVLLTVSVLGSEASAFFNLPAQIIAGGGLLYTNAQNSAGDYQINTISGETQNVQDRVSDSDTMDT